MIKLRRICDEEREKRRSYETLMERIKTTGSMSSEDSLRYVYNVNLGEFKTFENSRLYFLCNYNKNLYRV